MSKNDRGAAAVEFALILPVVLLLLFGIIDFGRAWNTKLTLTHAAREGVRAASVGKSADDVQGKVSTAATADGLTGVTTPTIRICPNTTGSAEVVTAKTYTMITPIGAIAGLFGSSFSGTIALTSDQIESCN